MNTETIHGIEYQKPTILLLQDTGIGTSEYAARTAYDSFENSENHCIREFSQLVEEGISDKCPSVIQNVNKIDHSDLLDQLAWTHFHHSVLEHANLTYLIKGISRGVLQELVRHRIASYTVRSTRYTMSSIINAFITSYNHPQERLIFRDLVPNFTIFPRHSEWFMYDCEYAFSKLKAQILTLGYDEFLALALSKEAIAHLSVNYDNPVEIFDRLQSSKKKRNVGDAFKHIVTDNWSVDLVITMNLRSLKNFFILRDSGSAYFQIRWLAQAMKEATPAKYLNLIIKDNK